MDYELLWKFSNMSHLDIAAAIQGEIKRLAREFFPDLVHYFPMNESPAVEYYFSSDFMIIKMHERHINAINTVGRMKTDAADSIISKINSNLVYSYNELYAIFGSEMYSFDDFLYIGPYSPTAGCWPHLQNHIVSWLNELVIPKIIELNKMRVERAVFPAASYNIGELTSSLWILECEETMSQGTAFDLEGVGTVTCAHVLGTKTMAFRANNINKRYVVEVTKVNSTIDLAVIRVKSGELFELKRGSSENLNQMDNVVISGFPNYRLGDTGIVSPGLVTGFRMVSGIRRFLTNIAIISGNSGGPVLNANSEVIGVAVTGADIMENSMKTENHGIIPIEALELF